MPNGLGHLLPFEPLQQFDLLSGIQIRELFPASEPAALVHGRESSAIGLLQILERSAKLAVDIVDDTRPRRPWVLIGGNDLIADRGQRLRFVDREE